MAMRRELPNRIDVPTQIVKGYLSLERNLTEARNVEVPKSVSEAYTRYKPVIESIYGSEKIRTDRFFHGTGYLQYTHESTPGTYTEGVSNIVDGIFDEGVKVAPDGWLGTPGNIPTTSLSRARFYARSYALLHETEDIPLEWQYGSKKDWAMYFALDTGLDMRPSEFLTLAYTIGKTHYGVKDGPRFSPGWFGKVRKDIPRDLKYMDLADAYSTIEGNFPVIAVFDAEAVSSYRVPALSRYEDRTMFDVPPGKLLALEVPLSQVEMVKNKARDSGVSIPVLPIECVDLHASHFPTEQHTKLQRNTRIEKQFKTGEKRRMTLQEADYESVPRNILDIADGTMAQDYHPQHVIDALSQSAFLSEQYAQIANWEGQTLHYNTLSTMIEHEKIFGNLEDLPGSVRKTFYRVLLALHDIGKPLAKHYKASQHYFNALIGTRVLEMAGATEGEIKIASTLLERENPVGVLLKKYGTVLHVGSRSTRLRALIDNPVVQDKIDDSIERTKKEIDGMAHEAGMEYGDMLQLLIMYNIADAASYTTDGGSVGSINYAFQFMQDGAIYAPSMQMLADKLSEQRKE